MKLNGLMSKNELLCNLDNQVEKTGIWWDQDDLDEYGEVNIDSLDYGYKHLIIDSQQKELIKLQEIDLDKYCIEHNINFVSEKRNSEIEFIHITKKSNLKEIKRMGLLSNCEANFIPDLGIGIYGVDANSEIGIDNVKTFIMDTSEGEIVVINGIYRGKYNYCFKGEGHEGYIVFEDELIEPEQLSFKIVEVDDFLLNY